MPSLLFPLAKMLGSPELHSRHVLAVGILVHGTWLPGSVTPSEDVMLLAVYIEKARWVTARSVNCWKHLKTYLLSINTVILWRMAGEN